MKTIIFDLDGTLVSSHEDVWCCLEQALEPFRQSIPAQIRADNNILLKSAGEILSLVYPQATPADRETYSQEVHRLYAQACKFEHTYLYPGILNLLEQLEQHGNRLLVITMKNEESARLVLAIKGIERFFAGVYSPDSFPPQVLKKAEIFQRVQEQYGLTADNCIAVGDQPADVLAAATLGLPTAAVLWGYGEAGALAQSQPAALVADVNELARFLLENGAGQ